MSEKRKWFSHFIREPQQDIQPEEALAPGQPTEIPIFKMDCELTAVTSQRNPSLKRLKEEGEKKLLEEIAKAETQQRLTDLKKQIKDQTKPYDLFFIGKAAELHATGEAKRLLGRGRYYKVTSYSTNTEDGAREYAYELIYSVKEEKNGEKKFTPAIYRQSLIPGNELQKKKGQELMIDFNKGKVSQVSIVLKDYDETNIDTDPRLAKYLPKFKRSATFFSPAYVSFDVQASLPLFEIQTEIYLGLGRGGYTGPKQEFAYSPDTNTLKFVNSSREMVGEEEYRKIERTYLGSKSDSFEGKNMPTGENYIKLLKDTLGLIPVTRIDQETQ